MQRERRQKRVGIFLLRLLLFAKKSLELRYYAKNRDLPVEGEPAALNKEYDEGAADEQRYALNAQPSLDSDKLKDAVHVPSNVDETTAYEVSE